MHGFANRFDDTRCLKAKTGRQRRRLDISARTQQRLGPVETQCLDPDLNLAPTERGNIEILDAQNLGTTMLMKANNTCHAAITPKYLNGIRYAIGPLADKCLLGQDSRNWEF